MNQTSTSLGKRKKGLSVSLEKKTKLNDEKNSTIQGYKTSILRQSLDSANSSTKKNKIRVAQSYQKHETGSKFRKQSHLKITDQDIKLGGSKKVSRCERKILPFTVTAPFSQYNSNIQFNPRHPTNFFYGQERKVLRQSKALNLTQNINYFHSLNLHKENTFCVPFNLARQNPETNNQNYLQQSVQLFKKLQTLIENKHQESQLTISPQKQMSTTPLKNQDVKEGVKSQISKQKQSMDRATLQKLKKVQIDIDQLLTKASQTRAMLLR